MHVLVRGRVEHERVLVEQLAVAVRGRGREVAAVAAHALVDDEHARVRRVLRDDVLEELGAVLGRGPRAERLADREHVVVDRLGQADDREVVVVRLEVLRELGRLRVGVVAADRVQDRDAVLDELLRRDLERHLALLDEAFLHAVGDIRQLDARVADRRAAVMRERHRVRAHLRRDGHEVAREQALVAALVADDLDRLVDRRVLLDEEADRRGKARREAAGGLLRAVARRRRRSCRRVSSPMVLGSKIMKLTTHN